ncbi:septal ring lytic transglycosylase RlpA family protein [uncultured Flavobacterium sp.]|uniref:septal ring lytic transglycosylase RlpA family protein n=1 Tax=uncultured Flavobacterium sp. TaxID=165435 RepID=UPI0025F4926C|nr:septal ring lytic transglycosylase RlpA family protein [uncultured Flavobacterium sp.]
MKYKTTIILVAFIALIFSSGFSFKDKDFQKNPVVTQAYQDSLKKVAIADSLKILEAKKYKLHKKNAHASYYADKFTGRRTASGKIFDNKKYTAAHRKFPFGTKLRITNEANGKSVIVEVTDRGPFTKGKEIDLTKKAFMEIASAKYGGHLKVTIEVMQ